MELFSDFEAAFLIEIKFVFSKSNLDSKERLDRSCYEHETKKKNNRFPCSTKNSNTVKPVSSGHPQGMAG